jgi:ATP-dependent RNA helicase DDX54/DBP10
MVLFGINLGISSTYIYGTLDPTARKVHLARFKHNKVKVLVVTDVAARGIGKFYTFFSLSNSLDVPLLDNVINYNFPASSKVFVHRVGRTARAGKTGSAYSLVSNEELSYMLDLQLFTGRPLVYSRLAQDPNYTTQLVYGTVSFFHILGSLPPAIDLVVESIQVGIKGNILLETLLQSSKQGYEMYLRSRPAATRASHSRGLIPSHGSKGNISSKSWFASHLSRIDIEEGKRNVIWICLV